MDAVTQGNGQYLGKDRGPSVLETAGVLRGDVGLGRLRIDEQAEGPMKSDRPRGEIQRRIDRAIREGSQAIARYHAATRAQAIISQHPEFAELLDLLPQI